MRICMLLCTSVGVRIHVDDTVYVVVNTVVYFDGDVNVNTDGDIDDVCMYVDVDADGGVTLNVDAVVYVDVCVNGDCDVDAHAAIVVVVNMYVDVDVHMTVIAGKNTRW